MASNLQPTSVLIYQLALHFLLLFHLRLQLYTRLDRVLSLPAVLNITQWMGGLPGGEA